MKRTPAGFYVCGCFSAIFGVAVAMGLWSAEVGNHVEAVEILGRGALAVLGALSAVATEALWRARPWAWHASLALAVAWAAAVMAMSFTESDGVMIAGIVLVLSAVVVGPILMYVHSRSRWLWPHLFPPPWPVRPRPRPRAPVPPHPRAGTRP